MSDIEPKDLYYHDLFQQAVVDNRDFSTATRSSSSSSFLTMHNNNNSNQRLNNLISTTSGLQGYNFDHFGTSNSSSYFTSDECLVPQDPMEYYNSFSMTPFGLSSSSSEVLNSSINDGITNNYDQKPCFDHDHHQNPVTMTSPQHDHSSISSSSTEAGGGDHHQEDSSLGKIDLDQNPKGSEEKDQEDDNSPKQV